MRVVIKHFLEGASGSTLGRHCRRRSRLLWSCRGPSSKIAGSSCNIAVPQITWRVSGFHQCAFPSLLFHQSSGHPSVERRSTLTGGFGWPRPTRATLFESNKQRGRGRRRASCANQKGGLTLFFLWLRIEIDSFYLSQMHSTSKTTTALSMTPQCLWRSARRRLIIAFKSFS